MEEPINPLEWKKNPVFISGSITLITLIVTLTFYFLDITQNLRIPATIALVVLGGITFLFYQNQCPKCKRIFSLNKVSDEIIKKWEEPKQYYDKTIFYYSDGITQKDVKNGATKTFIAKYEKHKDGYQCKKCQDTSYEIRDVFLNRSDWIRVTTPNKVTTSANKPKEHHTNPDNVFSSEFFQPTVYTDKSGKRKSIPSSVKKKLWIDYNGKKYKGPCFVCKEIIDINNFEAGHVIPTSKGGSDNISNLRPICKSCNRSMGDMNLNEFKIRYHRYN